MNDVVIGAFLFFISGVVVIVMIQGFALIGALTNIGKALDRIARKEP
jgi:hypothetical protein